MKLVFFIGILTATVLMTSGCALRAGYDYAKCGDSGCPKVPPAIKCLKGSMYWYSPSFGGIFFDSKAQCQKYVSNPVPLQAGGQR